MFQFEIVWECIFCCLGKRRVSEPGERMLLPYQALWHLFIHWIKITFWLWAQSPSGHLRKELIRCESPHFTHPQWITHLLCCLLATRYSQGFMLLLMDRCLIEAPFILINKGDLVLWWKCRVKPSDSFGLRWWGWKCSHMWKIADSPLSGHTGAHINQENVGMIFCGSVFGYLFWVWKEMEMKGLRSERELCCFYVGPTGTKVASLSPNLDQWGLGK